MILIVNKKKDNTHKNDIDNTIKSLILMIMIIVFLKNFTLNFHQTLFLGVMFEYVATSFFTKLFRGFIP